MTRGRRRWLVLLAAVVGVLGISTASASASPDTQQWRLGYRYSYSTMQFWRGALWVVRTDESASGLVTRIDVATGAATTVVDLRFGAGGFATGYGSLWVSDYFGNAVWRLGPDGTVQARIPTGGQPQYIALAFGSVWVSNHTGHSVTRIDPGTDGVVATVTAGDPTRFRNGPQGFAASDDRMWVLNSNQDVIQQIDPASDRPHDVSVAPDQFCVVGAFAAAGLMWIPDACTQTLYAHRADGSVAFSTSYPGSGVPTNVVVIGRDLWVGVDRVFDQRSFAGSHGALEHRDPTTGRLLGTVAVGGDVSDLVGGGGALWVLDNGAGLVRRVDPGTAAVTGVPSR